MDDSEMCGQDWGGTGLELDPGVGAIMSDFLKLFSRHIAVISIFSTASPEHEAYQDLDRYLIEATRIGNGLYAQLHIETYQRNNGHSVEEWHLKSFGIFAFPFHVGI